MVTVKTFIVVLQKETLETFIARSLSYNFFLRLEALTKKVIFNVAMKRCSSCFPTLPSMLCDPSDAQRFVLWKHIYQISLARQLLSHLLPNRQQKKTKKVKFTSCVFLLTFFCLWKWNHDGWGRRSVLFREHQEMGAVSAQFILKLNQHLFDFTVDYSGPN